MVPKDLTLEKQPQAILPPEAEIQAKPAITATQVNLKIVTSDLKIQKTIQKNNRLIGVIHVAAEETLGHYADWLSIATQTIRNLNRLPFGRAITIGQAIKIPLPETGSKDFEEQRYEFHQEILEDFFDSYFVASTQVYDIKSGDTLWFLCVNQLEIPLWLLEKYNPAINLARLKPGQQLTYPLVSPNEIHGDKNGEIHGL
ncbi:MAG: LysM peptidoglycan-binding domain-containing protein [Desulfobacter sp.]|nr:LysM peptidoglycan-binding domain-containing protein [Desulfobacter sp.]WDP87575.1 MAG: LysM peptidoglycan-binding domain-containing protein [Desulfobacter sp.]